MGRIFNLKSGDNKTLQLMRKKHKVHLSIMRTDFGKFPVLSNNQRVNRNTTVYYASRTIHGMNESIFYLVRTKDAEKLMDIGFDIQALVIETDQYAAAIGYNSGTILESHII